MANISPKKNYINKTKNRIVYKIKTSCKLKFIRTKQCDCLEVLKKDVSKDKNREDLK